MSVPHPVSEDNQNMAHVRVERLVALCKLWVAIKYFHPHLAYHDIDWDGALVAAIAQIKAGSSNEEYAAAVQNMLDALGDPITSVVHRPQRLAVEGTNVRAAADGERERDPRFHLTDDSILVITMSNYADLVNFVGAASKFQAIAGEIEKARGVVFDLRADVPPDENTRGVLGYLLSDSPLFDKVTSSPLTTPGERFRMHSGFPPQQGSSSGGYYSASYTVDGRYIAPGKDAKDIPLVFLINPHGELPAGALALQSAGKAAIIAEGDAPGDWGIVTKQPLEMPGGFRVDIRLSEIINADGSGGPRADIVFPTHISGSEDKAFAAALALARNFTIARTASSSTFVARAAPAPDRSYPEMRYPAVEYRLLAAFRMWGVISYFFPYKDLMNEDWDSVLREFIPKLEEARDETEYALAVAEMATYTHDTHVTTKSSVLDEFFGVATAPLLVQMIEDMPVVTRMLDEEVKATGIEVGDVVLQVDDERVEERLARLAQYVAASTPQALAYRLANLLLRGAENSTAMLVVRGRDGLEREVSLPRGKAYLMGTKKRTGDVLKLLPGNVGYADLDRLSILEVDAMFEKFKDTRAIIFDMRGYPDGTAWAIAPRLTEKDMVVAALFQRPIVMMPDIASGEIAKQWTSFTFAQKIPRAEMWKYKGKTVMLIDERTVSQAEHTGLFFEVANGTKFIGSHTNGANGDVTNFSVPGGIRISFSGHSVKHADGRQLQRLGLVPDVEVKPSIKGIQSGRDEVLEAAISYLHNDLNISTSTT